MKPYTPMIILASLITLVFAAAVFMAHSLMHAPIGVEDRSGFHRDTR